MSLPYTDVDVCWPGSAPGRRQPELATPVGVRVHPVAAFTYVRPGTPIPSSVVDIAG